VRLRLVLGGVLVVALVAGGLGGWWWTQRPPEFARAVGLAPADTERVGWTDWAAVREDLGADLGATSPADEVAAMLDAGFERDLTSASALGSSALSLHDTVGLSPATLDWELFAQSDAGAALLLRPPEDASFDDLGVRLESLGFARPDDDTGVWRGGPDVVARAGGTLTPELQHWVLLEDERLVVTSDTESYAAVAAAAAVGDGERVRGLGDVVVPTGRPRAAVVYSGGYACEHLAMAQADGPDQEQAAALVREAGTISPLTGFALSVQPGGGVRVALTFETDTQARANADSRAALAAGPAPGQGGDFSERFSVESVTAGGRTVVLELAPREGAYVMSDLSAGPVLFATC
jgi:hypothetical protein